MQHHRSAGFSRPHLSQPNHGEGVENGARHCHRRDRRGDPERRTHDSHNSQEHQGDGDAHPDADALAKQRARQNGDEDRSSSPERGDVAQWDAIRSQRVEGAEC
jgi:hypothetical protein